MNSATLLFVYGLFLISCGILAVSFIGLKAKTALASGSLSGIVSMTVGHFVYSGASWAPVLGCIVTAALFGVFAWRSTLTFYKVAELIPQQHADLTGKVKAFLIIALMAVVSIVVTLLQLTLLWS